MPASDWSDLCVQTILWEQMTGRDAYGKPAYGRPVQFAPPTGGRRVFKTVRRTTSGTGPAGSGVDFVQGSVIWLMATPPIGNEDRVYVLGDVARPPILLIESWPDETGVNLYTKITLGPFV